MPVYTHRPLKRETRAWGCGPPVKSPRRRKTPCPICCRQLIGLGSIPNIYENDLSKADDHCEFDLRNDFRYHVALHDIEKK